MVGLAFRTLFSLVPGFFLVLVNYTSSSLTIFRVPAGWLHVVGFDSQVDKSRIYCSRQFILLAIELVTSSAKRGLPPYREAERPQTLIRLFYNLYLEYCPRGLRYLPAKKASY